MDLSGEHVFLPSGAPIKVVDTTAAGDTFNAGDLSVIAKGGSSATAMQAGHAMADRVIAACDAIDPE